MRTKKRVVTIQDVAKAAGVSVSTVSRVLNGKTDVAGETQERILKVINKLGYTSNLAARSMRSLKKNLIGLVVPDIHPYSVDIMKGVNQAIAESTYDLLVYTTGDALKYGATLHEQHYISLLSNSITDGVIIVASATVEFKTDAPIVAVDPHVPNPKYPSVQGMNYQGALEAMEYLIKLGHKRIGFMSGREGNFSGERRFQGYKDALKNAGIEFDSSLVTLGDFVQKTSYKNALHLLQMDNRPTAIFAANDLSAFGVYQAAEELEIKIPEELSVIGFDNISEAKYLGLTSVDQFLADMGYKAVQMLIRLIEGETLERDVHKMQTKLVVRASCQELVQTVRS